MRIAVTGARGKIGREVVKLCSERGHYTVQVNRTDQEYDGTPNSEMRTADLENYYDTVEAFRGCDAVIHLTAISNTIGKEDWKVHNNNVDSAFNDVIGVCAYANQPLHFDYFPIDEDAPQNPRDSYALAKQEAEIQARAFVNWFLGIKVACLRIHEVAPLKDVQKEHEENWEQSAVKQLWGWVNPQATARACLLAVEKSDNFEGAEIFNIVAPTTTQDTPSKELAKKYFPNTEIRGDMSKNQSFWTTDKAKRVLG